MKQDSYRNATYGQLKNLKHLSHKNQVKMCMTSQIVSLMRFNAADVTDQTEGMLKGIHVNSTKLFFYLLTLFTVRF